MGAHNSMDTQQRSNAKRHRNPLRRHDPHPTHLASTADAALGGLSLTADAFGSSPKVAQQQDYLAPPISSYHHTGPSKEDTSLQGSSPDPWKDEPSQNVEGRGGSRRKEYRFHLHSPYGAARDHGKTPKEVTRSSIWARTNHAWYLERVQLNSTPLNTNVQDDRPFSLMSSESDVDLSGFGGDIMIASPLAHLHKPKAPRIHVFNASYHEPRTPSTPVKSVFLQRYREACIGEGKLISPSPVHSIRMSSNEAKYLRAIDVIGSAKQQLPEDVKEEFKRRKKAERDRSMKEARDRCPKDRATLRAVMCSPVGSCRSASSGRFRRAVAVTLTSDEGIGNVSLMS